jgi:hypothetical protein
MEKITARNRSKRSKMNNTERLINEMQKRKKACLVKLQKLSDRINILEQFKNETEGKNVSLKNYLKSKGYDYKDMFCPMGYFTPKMMVVSDDMENDYLTYHKGMSFNKNVGYHIPEREIVEEKDHQEITSSIYGMTWNPALMQYYPTTVFDTKAYTSAEEIGDSGMDMIGGLKTEDYGNLTNENEYGQELVSMVQGLLEEEFDNVESELDVIEEAEMKLNGFSNFESEDAKVKSGRNLTCRAGCGTKHPFNKTKRESCQAECDKKFKPSQKQEARRQDREERQDARQEFRADKKDCKARLKSGELTRKQYRECVKKERKEKRSQIKDAGGNVLVRGWRGAAKVNPLTAGSRGGALILIGRNAFGFATRLAPALLPDAQAKELFKPESIVKAKKGWEKVSRAWRNLGGDPEKLKNTIIQGYNKKPEKIPRNSSFSGESFYEVEEYSNFAEPVVTAALITGGAGVLVALTNLIAKIVERNPYKADRTPQDFQDAIADGTVETNPPSDPNAPTLNDKGEWIEPRTGKVIDPLTGKYKDTIFGINKWLAIGIGVAGVVGLYYIFKGKK